MDREKLFEDFLTQCKNREEICGQGNPNADILIIGKEPYSEEIIDPIKDRQKYLDYLIEKNNNCRVHCFNRATNDFSKLRTWQNYQKLIFSIYEGIKYNEYNKNVVDFESFAYTTELSSTPRPKSDYNLAKGMIQKRLDFFKNSDFIQKFPVVVLACGGYIVNREEKDILQINETFGVQFDNELNSNGIPKGWHKSERGRMWFATHHSIDGRKLVIHTWQLSRCLNFI